MYHVLNRNHPTRYQGFMFREGEKSNKCEDNQTTTTTAGQWIPGQMKISRNFQPDIKLYSIKVDVHLMSKITLNICVKHCPTGRKHLMDITVCFYFYSVVLYISRQTWYPSQCTSDISHLIKFGLYRGGLI